MILKYEWLPRLSFVIGLQNVYPAIIVFEQLIKLNILPITFKHSIPNPKYLSHDY